MAKPNVLCKLSKGRLIDTFRGFVDTFNYMLDFIENLKGEGEHDSSLKIKVDRTVPDHPVIRISGGGFGGDASFKFVGTDASEAILGNPDAEDPKVVTFESASDANVSVNVAADGTNGNIKLTLGAYYA